MLDSFYTIRLSTFPPESVKIAEYRKGKRLYASENSAAGSGRKYVRTTAHPPVESAGKMLQKSNISLVPTWTCLLWPPKVSLGGQVEALSKLQFLAFSHPDATGPHRHA
jgi:hypothetical protein